MNNLEIKPGLLVLTSSFFGNKICNVRFFFRFFFNLTVAYVDWELESWISLLKRKKSVRGISRVIHKTYGVDW